MYCQKCGHELHDEAVVCLNCGCAVNKVKDTVAEKDAPNFGYSVLGFFIPIVGLILYLVWKDATPLKAKSAGKGALIGFITVIVLYILLFVFYFFLMLIIFSAPDEVTTFEAVYAAVLTQLGI